MTTNQLRGDSQAALRVCLMLLLLVIGPTGCGESIPTSGSRADRAREPPRATISPTDPAPMSPSARPLSVSGLVATEREEGVGDRIITIVDARGRRFDVVTDRRGAFAVDDVAPPYDLVVASAATSETSPTAQRKDGATVFVGLKRADPHIELAHRAAERVAPQVVRARLPSGVCRWEGGGTIFVLTTSMAGEGSAILPCDGSSEEEMVIDVAHALRGAADANETLDVHVLVSDEARTAFAYARKRDAATASSGLTTDVGLLEPLVVRASSAPLILGADEGDLGGWSWATEVVLEADGTSSPDGGGRGGGFLFATSMRPNEAMNVPLLPGLVVRTRVTATHPRLDGRGRAGAHQSLRAWSGPLWPGAIGHLLTMPRAPEVVRPAPGSIFSRHGQGFAWRMHGEEHALTTLTVTDLDRGGGVVRYRIMTEAREVTLAKLSTMGLLGELLIGNHRLDLATTPSVSVDHVCSPDPRLRRAESEERHRGASTQQSFTFQVVQ